MLRRHDSDDILATGIALLEQHLGKEKAKEFVNKIRQVEIEQENSKEETEEKIQEVSEEA
jgi:hypothetical protein